MVFMRHGCGHRIWLVYRWTGIRYRPEYRDEEEESPTAGEYITHCPTCGEFLSTDDLLAENTYLIEHAYLVAD